MIKIDSDGSQYMNLKSTNRHDAWIVGRMTKRLEGHPDYVTWDLLGVFDNHDLAVELCVTRQHFIIPTQLNLPMDMALHAWSKKRLNQISETSNDKN